VDVADQRHEHLFGDGVGYRYRDEVGAGGRKRTRLKRRRVAIWYAVHVDEGYDDFHLPGQLHADGGRVASAHGFVYAERVGARLEQRRHRAAADAALSTLSLHDALPISVDVADQRHEHLFGDGVGYRYRDEVGA